MNKIHLGLLALAAAAQVQAAEPLHFPVADVLATGSCEVVGGIGRMRHDAEQHANLYSARFACGAFSGTQFGVKVQRADTSGMSGHWTQLTLDGKTELLARRGDGLGLSLAYSIDAIDTSWNSGLQYVGSTVALTATQQFGAHRLHGLLGLNIAKGGDRNTGWALGYEFAVLPQLSLLAEYLGGEDSKPAAGLGLRWQTSKAWDLGLMLVRDRNEPRTTLTQLNARFAF